MREKVKDLVGSKRWEFVIIGLIVINAVTLGLETSPYMMEVAGPLLLGIDRAILSVFVVEIALRLYAHGLRFFKDPWSIFDFVIVGIALLPANGPLAVLRSLRILRVLRLISVVPSLKRVIGGLIAALPGMGSIVVLMALVFYVFAVMATKLYGATFPEWFGDIAKSTYTLFQIMTLESWSMGIVRPVMEAYPYAWLFFVPFILCTAFTVLNLFIGIIVSAMQEEHEQEADANRQAIHDETVMILEEVKALRAEVRELRANMNGNGSLPQ
ncbi:voltage-gated sodium channel [Roseibium hamelinense]|uniref:Voltage-gated sodium channel n=1 Tax=Roseibium hamelinense TaxID=150831 RepID=A0A562STK4_9HYPH|nr:ion transporter [Roseibium hamelinense]MTI43060.1 ion transporter [Roseibium hamelinense]TWI84637.1 voltage-gated sodium channel [Roseibium hamelinense]